jgi:secretion/DNA translocation related TadE-like protein
VTGTKPGGRTGSASIWVLSCSALLLLVASVGVLRAAAIVARHRAESAADLAALAAAGRIGVTDSICPAAAAVAARNGATLRSCTPALAPDGRSGTVTTRVALRVSLPLVGTREVIASARAGRLAVPP